MALLLGLIVLLIPLIGAQQICKNPYCECIPAAHPSWTTVNCTLPQGQTLDVGDSALPDTTTDFIVTGAEALLFGPNALSRLKDIRHIRAYDSKVILIRTNTAINLNVISVYLDVQRCEVMRIEGKAFSQIKGPLSVSVLDCDYVSFDSQAFSWLLSMSVSNAIRLDLFKEAFMLDSSAGNVGEHGPGLTIDLHNMTIPELTPQVFGSSAASITFDTVYIRVVRAGAFSANTYNMISVVNSSIHVVQGGSFAQKSLINNLQFSGSKVHDLDSNAIESAIANLNITHTRFVEIKTGAINATVASVVVLDSTFNIVRERGFELSSWNKFQMERNSFDDLFPNAIVAPASSVHELIFNENEIESANEDCLAFISQVHAQSPESIVYKKNYFGQTCHCNVTTWLSKILGAEIGESYEAESFCTVNEFFARCFNVPEQNMVFKKFLDGVCGESSTITCENYKSKEEAEAEIKNPRFPHKKDNEGLSDRNKKVIGIVIGSCLICVVVVAIISIIRWMRQRGYCINCINFKNFLASSNASCASLCDTLCVCGSNNGVDNARSISQLSVNEYSERHRLNEPRVQDNVQETTLPEMYADAEPSTSTDDKTTQTLPEELTKELLENLREKLEEPENYMEAREMIEHLYELIKVQESCNSNTPTLINTQENIYELPFQNTTPRIGKNKKKMISVGTRAPSLDKLMPLSPYNRQTALAHEYFEPKDFAVHLYAEIANCDKERKNLLSAMPDVVGDQLVPRGPYLRAVREKMGSNASASPTKSMNSPIASPKHSSTLKSNKSTLSNTSMVNRPLPEKPSVSNACEGTSFG